MGELIFIAKNRSSFCKNLEKNHARARVTPPKLQKRAPKVGGFAAHFWCPFFEFWRAGTRSRIVFLQLFARWPLILSDDDSTNKSQKMTFRLRPPTDTTRLVPSKLLLWGGSRRQARPFWPIF